MDYFRHLERNFMNHVEGIRIELFGGLENPFPRGLMYQLGICRLCFIWGGGHNWKLEINEK